MGWGMGFDNSIKNIVSYQAEVYINFAKVKPVSLNRFRHVIDTLYMSSISVRSDIVESLVRDGGVALILPIARSVVEFSKGLPAAEAEEMYIKMKLAGWSVTASGGLFLDPAIAKSEYERKPYYDKAVSVIEHYAPARILNLLTPEQRSARLELLNAIDRGEIYTGYRRS